MSDLKMTVPVGLSARRHGGFLVVNTCMAALLLFNIVSRPLMLPTMLLFSLMAA